MNTKELRESLNLSQADFATLLNVRQATISDWERGKRKPSKHLLEKLEKYSKKVENNKKNT